MKLAELLEKKAAEKTSEEIFIQAFEDELLKLGWSDELIKEAGIGQLAGKALLKLKGAGKAVGKVLWGGKKSMTQTVKMTGRAKPKSLVSAAKQRARKLAEPGFPVLPGEMKDVRKVERMRDLVKARARG